MTMRHHLLQTDAQGEGGSSCGEITSTDCDTVEASPVGPVELTADEAGISRIPPLPAEDPATELRPALSNSVKALTTGAALRLLG